MDRPALHAFVREVVANDRFAAFTAALPARARVSESVLPLLLAALHDDLDRPLVCLLPEDADARDAAEAAGWFVGSDRVALLPGRGVRRDSGLEPPPHLVGERARALDVLAAGGLVCASATALAEGLPPAARRPETVRLAVGAEPGVDGLAESLVDAGYERVERVDERGQFAVRGGLVDVFPTTGREPLRIEFFGDEIEAIRAFSPVHAARPPSRRGRDRLSGRRAPNRRVRRRFDRRRARPCRCSTAFRTSSGSRMRCAGSGKRKDSTRSTSTAPPSSTPSRGGSRSRSRRSGPRSPREGSARRRTSWRPSCGVASGSWSRSRTVARRCGRRTCSGASTPSCSSPATPFPRIRRFASRSRRRAAGSCGATSASSCFPDTQVFRKRPPRADARLGRALASFADLRTGDFVVHEDHGVGKLLGFETKEVANVTRDYLFLAFRGEDRLYVPHEQLGKISRYIGADARAPSLSKLGGKAWQNLKARARESVRELAGELLQLYARRQSSPGTAYELQHEWLERLEAEFPYRETEDQERAIEAVKADLEAPRPMDRLVCGDVGFGKTEVAVRAAFSVAVNGRQTLVLCPTTILAEQHWNTFRSRYRDFPVRVEMVSRFRSPAAVKKTLQEFADGKVDVLVGTHRVLSRDVIPKNLGLVILDEEQRFGVAQKELLRSLRLEVDVLALSATPIPRTLHMSLSGLRDISIIETPPEGRRPIRTTVGEYDEDLIRVALEREAPAAGRPSTSTTASRRSTMPQPSCSSSARGSASSSRTGRCGSGSWRSGCTRSSRATRTCSSRRRSSSRASTSRRRTR